MTGIFAIEIETRAELPFAEYVRRGFGGDHGVGRQVPIASQRDMMRAAREAAKIAQATEDKLRLGAVLVHALTDFKQMIEGLLVSGQQISIA
jgi:hypothetical protein